MICIVEIYFGFVMVVVGVDVSNVFDGMIVLFFVDLDVLVFVFVIVL